MLTTHYYYGIDTISRIRFQSDSTNIFIFYIIIIYDYNQGTWIQIFENYEKTKVEYRFSK